MTAMDPSTSREDMCAPRMKDSLTPSYLEVSSLDSLTDCQVRSHMTDGNGHMNVRHIYSLGVDGADLLAEQAGIDDGYRSQRRMGIFAVEHNIRFFAEMRENQALSVHPLWIDRSERVGHILVFILNRTTRTVSSILELAVAHVDLNSRSSVPFPQDIGAELDRCIVITRAGPWHIPTSGAVGVRRR
jgi:acyl-CoA thioester hydrolase